MSDKHETRLWRKRAESAGFVVWRGQRLQAMTGAEIEAAFDGLSHYNGISYVWGSGTQWSDYGSTR